MNASVSGGWNRSLLLEEYYRFSERYYHAHDFALWFRGESPPANDTPPLPAAMWWLYGGMAGCLLCVGVFCLALSRSAAAAGADEGYTAIAAAAAPAADDPATTDDNDNNNNTNNNKQA